MRTPAVSFLCGGRGWEDGETRKTEKTGKRGEDLWVGLFYVSQVFPVSRVFSYRVCSKGRSCSFSSGFFSTK